MKVKTNENSYRIINDNYFDASLKRLAQHQSQTTLF